MSHELCCSPWALTPNPIRQGWHWIVPLFSRRNFMSPCQSLRHRRNLKVNTLWQVSVKGEIYSQGSSQTKSYHGSSADMKSNFYFQIPNVLTATLGKQRGECVVWRKEGRSVLHTTPMSAHGTINLNSLSLLSGISWLSVPPSSSKGCHQIHWGAKNAKTPFHPACRYWPKINKTPCVRYLFPQLWNK